MEKTTCDVCGYNDRSAAVKMNGIRVNYCCMPFMINLAKCNKRNFWEELEIQTKYLKQKQHGI
ncbi:MAG: hypothetical protein LBE36_06515 [Flavobacteriaceae bacterium]|jgi:hypothetical protein|nr:hypothetical protein [Flavobacteriaceae bacterium]